MLFLFLGFVLTVVLTELIQFYYAKNFVCGCNPDANANVDVLVAAADAEVTIEGPAQADIVKKEVHNGVLTIDYLPVIPGEYMVSVKSHGKHIHGSPFSARISGSTAICIIGV